LRQESSLDGTFIAILTADAMGDGATLFRELGADHFLTKPIDIPAILELLEDVATRETGLPA
jgi:CheY-like chemotaxis protein